MVKMLYTNSYIPKIITHAAMKQAPVLEELKDLAVQTPGQKTLKKILKESLGISYMIAGDPKSDERLSKEIKDLSYYIKWGGACDTGAGVLQRNHTIYPVYFNSYDFNKLKDLIKKNPPFKIEEMDSKDHLWVEGEKENLGLWTNEAALSLNQKSI